jgi:hypothetical protein
VHGDAGSVGEEEKKKKIRKVEVEVDIRMKT